MTQKIHLIGETVLDIIFKNGQPIIGNPGGSILNTAVSLGRLGLKPFFMSDYCQDKVGQLIKNFLIKNGVEPYQTANNGISQTSIALAFLDNNNNAEYQFYKSRPQNCDSQLFKSDFKPNDILGFGSFYAIMPEIRLGVEKLISDAKKAGAIVLYDPNFRKPHLKDLPKVKNYILYNIKNADIVKGSDEDFELIFGTKTEQETFEIIKKLNPEISFFYTKGALGSVFMRENYKIEFLAPKIEVVNTIGAGDNYNAGIIYGLVNYCKKFYNNTYFSAKKLLAQMPTDEIKKILNIATDFSQRVCQSSENYITV